MYVNAKNFPVSKAFKWHKLMKGESEIIFDFPIFEKRTYSGLTKRLKAYLKYNNLTDVYLCGVYTDACVLAAAFSLFDAGYVVHIVKDCCEAFDDKLHENAIAVLSRNMNDVCTLEQVKESIV